MMATIKRKGLGQEKQRDVLVTPEAGPARTQWKGEFWTPIADRYEPGEEIFISLKDGRTGHGRVVRIELDNRITTNCRIEFVGISPLG